MSSLCSFYNTFQKLLLNRLNNSKRKFHKFFFSPFISIPWKPLWSYNFTLFWISCTFSHSAAVLPFHLGQEFSFSACGFDVFRTQRMCWEKMFTATSVILGSQRSGGCGQPWEHLWLLVHPSWCCSCELWLPLLGRCSLTAPGILILPALGRGRGWVSRNLGSSLHYFQSGFNKLCYALQ